MRDIPPKEEIDVYGRILGWLHVEVRNAMELPVGFDVAAFMHGNAANNMRTNA